jgi:MFS family permease
VLVALFLLFFVRRVGTIRSRVATVRPRLSELRPVLRPLTLLYFAVVSRSAVSYGFMTFLPLQLTHHGYSVTQVGAIASLYLGCGALGGFLGGWLAERWGGGRVVLASFLGSAPLYLAFLFLPDTIGLACLVAGSFILQASLPVNVVMGQELSPRHASTISSLLMGAAWGLGALLVSPVGALADRWGLHVALLSLASMLLVGLVCAALLPGAARTVVADLPEPVGGAAGD